jgi:hypothetical protein
VAQLTAARPRGRRARPLLLTGRRRAARVLKPARPAFRNLASVPLHVTGLGCTDFAAFHAAHGWGWLVTGVSLMWLEHVIADET